MVIVLFPTITVREDMDFGPLINMLGGLITASGAVQLRTRRGLFKCSA